MQIYLNYSHITTPDTHKITAAREYHSTQYYKQYIKNIKKLQKVIRIKPYPLGSRDHRFDTIRTNRFCEYYNKETHKILLEFFPESYDYRQNLKNITYGHNTRVFIHYINIRKQCRIDTLDRIEEISISYYEYNNIPKFIKRCRNLTSLSIYTSPIKMIPKWISVLKKLTHIKFKETDITYIPKQINSPRISWYYLDISGHNIRFVDISKSNIKYIQLGKISDHILFPRLPANSCTRILFGEVNWPSEYNWKKFYVDRNAQIIPVRNVIPRSVPKYILDAIDYD